MGYKNGKELIKEVIPGTKVLCRYSNKWGTVTSLAIPGARKDVYQYAAVVTLDNKVLRPELRTVLYLKDEHFDQMAIKPGLWNFWHELKFIFIKNFIKRGCNLTKSNVIVNLSPKGEDDE